jgi:hypothetical protein
MAIAISQVRGFIVFVLIFLVFWSKLRMEEWMRSQFGQTYASRVSRPMESHHRPLVEPSVKLSAPIRQTSRSYGCASERTHPGTAQQAVEGTDWQGSCDVESA